ncbi:ammonia monooxygenase subunit B [Cenarchaeum symbiosum A]|uniref:Ammonia monooxygenase subunit B n=1 Tax=Cenarchaeum symbiosum (strain A) TaxID=414004 RepID=A0RUL3_CENSY|nr:ammonia monooxygenase subunit B [Cenarchaeum symbiosum A]
MAIIDKKLMVVGLGMVLALGTLGFNWMEAILPSAEAHGVQAQLQSRFIRIEDETFNRQSLQTGETLCLAGSFVSLVERDLRGWNSIFSESTNAGNRWEILSRDPPGNVFDIPGNSEIPYEICALALEPGVYHVHTQLNVATVGPGLGPGQTVVVDGEFILKEIPYTNIAYQSIIIGVGYVITFATRPWQVI